MSRAATVAVAGHEDERREELGIAAGLSEAETLSNDFLRFLAGRGLHGTKLVIVEDHKGF